MQPIRSDILRGKRVRLGALRAEDAQEIARWQEEGGYLRLFDSLPALPQGAAALAQRIAEAAGRHDTISLAIRRREDDALLGLLELDGIQWAHGTTSLSIVILDPSDRGVGYGQEALELALDLAFSELNLHRVELTVFAYNTQAIRLYEGLGFRHEGTHREYLQRDGRRYDMLLYGLLRHEWRGRQP